METQALSIPELFKIIRHSFQLSEFDEVQEILMDREEKMKIEIQDLKRDLDSTKRAAHLLENSQSLAELDKLRMEEKLQKSRRTCGELNEKIARLSEELRVSCDRAKRADDRHAKLSKEVSDVICDKNKLILDLEGKINELMDTIVEKEELVVELRRKQYQADKEVAELKLQILEATRQRKMGIDGKPENTARRVMSMEAGLGKRLNVKVEDEDLASPAANGKKLEFSDSIKGRTNADIENVATTGSDDTPLLMKGCRNVVHTEEDGAIGRTSGSQFKHKSSGAEINDTAQDNEEKKPVFSGSHRVLMRTPGGSRHSGNRAVLHSATNEVIDEAKPGGTTYISNTSYLQTTRKRKLV